MGLISRVELLGKEWSWTYLVKSATTILAKKEWLLISSSTAFKYAS